MNEDRIWEMFYEDTYQASTQRACRDRIHWLAQRARGRVVDVGCSQGVLPILLGREGHEVVGVDIEAPVIEFARAKLAEEPESVRGRVTFVQADVLRWQPTGRFDTLIMGEVLEHVHEPRELLAATRQLLADDGRLLLTVPLGWLEHHDHKQAFLPPELIELLEEFYGVDELEIADDKIRVVALANRTSRPEAVDAKRLLAAVGQALLAGQYHAVAVARSHAESVEEVQAKLDQLVMRNRSLVEGAAKLWDDKRRLKDDKKKILGESNKLAARAEQLAARVAQLKERNAALVAAGEQLRNSGRYKLGRLLVRAGLHPTTLPRLPFSLAALAFRGLRHKDDPVQALPGSPRAGSVGSGANGEQPRPLVQQVYDGTYRVDIAEARPVADRTHRRILHLLEYSLPHMQNGYTLRSYQIVRAQKQHGWDPVVITKPGFPDNVTTQPGPEAVAGVPHYRLPNGSAAGDGSRLAAHIRTYVTEAAPLVAELRPQLVQASSNFRNAYAALELARNYQLPFVYEVRGLWEETRVANGALDRDDEQYDQLLAAECYCMNAADAIVTLGTSLKDELIARGIAADKIFLVPNGVDVGPERIREPRADLRASLGLNRRFVVSYIGSVSPLESLHVLVHAIRVLARRRQDIAALIVGGGADVARLEQLVADLGVGELVRFTGSVPHDQIADYYAITDVVACTRGNDRVCEVVTPLKPYEAMAYRKPVIVSDIPALREMVSDHVTGRIVPPADPHALARVLADLADHPDECAKLAERAYAWVAQNRTWERVTEGYGPAYEHALESFAKRSGRSRPA